jgi:acetyl esterase/lipase
MIVVAPKEPPAAPVPVLIHLKFMPELIAPLVERGFIVANIDWREPPDHKLPVGVQDVKCAIRYLRANAGLYNLDPQRIGVFGCSRGGHMAALVGVTDPGANMEGSPDFADRSSRAGAVVMFDGIANFKTNYAGAAAELESVHGITSFDDPQMTRLSPISYVTPDDPPFLIIASTSTDFRAQDREMENALQAAKVPVTYLEAEKSTHCRFGSDGPHTVEGIANIMHDFFNTNLK